MKLVIEQRTIINNFLRRSRGGKVSFTHIIGYAMVQALKALPEMNNGYEEPDGHPTLIENPSINLGIAVDVTKADGTRQLLVPNIRGCENLDFAEFRESYEDVIKRAREGRLTVDDFAGTTASLTNPGGIGTTHSVPRLMTGQGVILGVGSIAYAPEFEGTSLHRLNELGRLGAGGLGRPWAWGGRGRRRAGRRAGGAGPRGGVGLAGHGCGWGGGVGARGFRAEVLHPCGIELGWVGLEPLTHLVDEPVVRAEVLSNVAVCHGLVGGGPPCLSAIRGRCGLLRPHL